MTCAEAAPLLHARLDGELDVYGSLQMERHLSECGACSEQYAVLEKLRQDIAAAGLDWSRETDLRRLRGRIRAAQRPRHHLVWWPAIAASLAAIAFVAGTWVRPAADFDREVVDTHVRSLMSGHPVDVPSSDRHTVKPWFQGKVDFSPPTPDLSSAGFELVGGRLEELAGRRAAAVVYRHGGHIIDLLMVRGAVAVRGSETLDGFNVISWQSRDLTFWAASDLEAAQLKKFRDLIR